MNSLLIEFTLLLCAFTLFYLIVKSKLDYNLQRRYIFLAIFISLACPFLPQFSSQTLGPFGILLPELLIATEGQTIDNIGEQISWIQIAKYLFIAITTILLISFTSAIFKLLRIIKKGTLAHEEGQKIILSTEIKNPCSFFDYILLPAHIAFTPVERAAIIKHETLHIEYKHSQEKIFIELIKIIFWWHPALWYFKKELTLIHEYQVDETMVNIMNPKSYRDILLQLVIHPPGLRMSNPLSSHIKKRFIMMNQNKKHLSKSSSWLLTIAFITTTFFIHACQTEDATPSDNVVQLIDKTETANGIYKYSETDTVIAFNPETFEEKIQVMTTEYEAYQNPETMPLYPGCADKECSTQNLLKYLYKNLVYPAEARTKSIEGMVVLQFVITDSGEMTNLKIAKDLDGGCGQAAFKVLQSLQNLEQKWTPGSNVGQKVYVQYTLPVKFKLQ